MADERRQFLVVERYVHGAAAVYQRFAEKGRMLPAGVVFRGSWIIDEPVVRTCYQVMEADGIEPIREWMARWSDIVEFEVHAVLDSAEAAARVRSSEDAGHLDDEEE